MDTYSHWGSLALGDGVSKVPEPNNQYPPEYCVAANYSMVNSDKIWSWADTNCTAGMFPYICKITRGCLMGGLPYRVCGCWAGLAPSAAHQGTDVVGCLLRVVGHVQLL
jgi:hypothetical protein